jgi:hypothetical protein
MREAEYGEDDIYISLQTLLHLYEKMVQGTLRSIFVLN